MEHRTQNWSFNSQPEKNNDDTSSNGTKTKSTENAQKVNSWDCSTPSDKSKPRTSQKETNDWDSSSECQETMVEPFDSGENPKDGENWDSDEGEKKPEEGKRGATGMVESLDSYELSNSDFSDLEKTSLMGAGNNGDLLVEDFEEFDIHKLIHSPTESDKVRSNESEGTQEDTTIWMIPKSERTQSGDSTSKLISSSDREKIGNLKKFKHFLKKAKSLSDVEKRTVGRKSKSSRSESLLSETNNKSERLNWERKLEIETVTGKEKKSGCESFDRTRVFFTEYECRTMTVEKDTPESSTGSGRNAETDSESNLGEERGNEPGTSGLESGETVALPDVLRKTLEDSGATGDESGISGTVKTTTQTAVGTQMSESWLLLDDTGQYQAISKNEVSILLNGRSAEAVLQGRKQHFIPNSTLKDRKTLRNSLTDIVTNDSSHNFSKEEDLGGEDDRKKLIDLERKLENTLFFIQPGMNLTASVRLIPVETEMIHVWKRARDGGSVLSSEIDLLQASQESVTPVNQRTLPDRNSSLLRRHLQEQTVAEENPTESPLLVTGNRSTEPVFPETQQSQTYDYSNLLIETRMIVDSLTNNFRALQSRLDGETTRSMALQGEVNKLRLLVKSAGSKHLDRCSRETIFDPQMFPSNMNTSPSLLTLKALDKADIRSESIIEEECEEEPGKRDVELQDESTSMDQMSATGQAAEDTGKCDTCEDNDIITVNIYAVESRATSSHDGKAQETYSMVQSNLGLIEKKMKRLQQENELVTVQNQELKKKLKEISLELEKYLASTSDPNPCVEEGRELESLRDQVCNLKLELENLKKNSRAQERKLAEENSLIRDQYSKSIQSLEEWLQMATQTFRKLQTITAELQEIGIRIDVNFDREATENPTTLTSVLICWMEKTTERLFAMKDENNSYEQASKGQLESKSLDEVITGYSELIKQCRKGQNSDESKVMEDYFTVIMEKASLVEEVKILKTENEMLLESQLEHYEKLKQTMIALKDRKSEISALESSRKLTEDEKNKMAEVIRVYDEERKKMEVEILEKTKNIENLIEELKRKDEDSSERIKALVSELKNLEKSCQTKEKLIDDLKRENEQLSAADSIKNEQIELLKNDIKNLQIRGNQLETELTSTKVFLNESEKEMKNYISHLESLLNNSQDAMDKLKQKLKEANQMVNRLKTENEVMEKQHQYDVKLFNGAKDELDSCKEKLTRLNNKYQELEEEKEKLYKKYECLASSEKEKSDALDALTRQHKAVVFENEELKDKLEMSIKDKDEVLEEQKDLIAKYGMLSKEIQKLQDKYRSVKTECNERTDLIRYLELMMKENLAEYNNRIVGLEQNISEIIEKIIACKKGMRTGHDSEAKELRHQLNVTYQERKELENLANNYYSLMKRLEHEVEEREKKLDELHVKLTVEQQKAVEYENERKLLRYADSGKNAKGTRVEELEDQIAVKESQLAECKQELQKCRANYENETKKLELTIADLKSEVKRYQLRIEVMMRNLANAKNGTIIEKRSDEDMQAMKKEAEEKTKLITELNETIKKHKADIKLKDSDLENSKKKISYLEEEIEKLENLLSAANKANEIHQKEKDEMAEKLFQSIKLIMEERSTRQTLETLLVEKENNYKNQIDKIQHELNLKIKERDVTTEALEDKKQLVLKLQNDLRKAKAEVASFKTQISNYKRKISHMGSGDELRGETPIHTSSIVSSERLESCLNELKQIRDLNLELRKTEGQYQAKIVRLEDEIRDARLLIKELQGDIKTEKKSKKAFKNMIVGAKMEVEKCVLSKQLMSVVAERIKRHLNLLEIPSRELLSGLRLNDSSSCMLE